MGVKAVVIQQLSWKDVSATQTRGCTISQSINLSVLKTALKEQLEIPSLELASSWKGQ